MPPALAAARLRLITRWTEQCKLATLTVLLDWLQVDGRLKRLLAEKPTPLGRRGR